MRYLDPLADMPHRQQASSSQVLSVPTLKGVTVALVNNSNASMAKIHDRIEGILLREHEVKAVRRYEVPRNFAPPAGTFERVVEECDVALFGLAN